MNNFTIGADPEIFVGDDTSVRSIVGKIGGTKEHPLGLPLGEGFAVQEDNVALEFNIPPSKSKAEFVRNICTATQFLEQTMIDRHNLHFVKQASASFPLEELMTPEALVFGCDPDYNAWTKRRNPRPHVDDPSLRSCGGHVHIGLDGLDPITVVKGCDLFLAIPSLFMDKDEQRRLLYGKAGAHRIKPFGVEYRTLSNFWVFEPKYIEWVHDNVSRALDAVSNNFDFDSEQENIVNAINNNDRAIADMLVQKYQLQVV